MNAITVMIAINRAKNQKTDIIPVMFDDVSDSGLKYNHITKNEQGKPLFAYVNKQEYISYLEHKHQLIKKRTALTDVLRNSIRKS